MDWVGWVKPLWLFDKVIMTHVSKNPNIKKIQEEIADLLGGSAIRRGDYSWKSTSPKTEDQNGEKYPYHSR
jgi:hypothetical protein